MEGKAESIRNSFPHPQTKFSFQSLSFFLLFLMYFLFEISLPALCSGLAFVCANLSIFPLPISNFLPVRLIYKGKS